MDTRESFQDLWRLNATSKISKENAYQVWATALTLGKLSIEDSITKYKNYLEFIKLKNNGREQRYHKSPMTIEEFFDWNNKKWEENYEASVQRDNYLWGWKK